MKIQPLTYRINDKMDERHEKIPARGHPQATEKKGKNMIFDRMD
jgi:hypothetical protein